jgi:plastocyanin
MRISLTGRRRAGVFALVAAGALLLAACGGNGDTNGASGSTATTSSGSSAGSETTSKTIAGEQVNYKDTATVTGKTSQEVELDDYYFGPTVLVGKPGQKLTLELKNEGTTDHNFTLASQNFNEDLKPGATTKVTVTIPNSGTVLFHCEYHESMGMRGALQAAS